MFFKIRCPLRYPIFVSFATFVVLKSFVEWLSLIIDRLKNLRKLRELLTIVVRSARRKKKLR
jgi:hypothetical protein